MTVDLRRLLPILWGRVLAAPVYATREQLALARRLQAAIETEAPSEQIEFLINDSLDFLGVK